MKDLKKMKKAEIHAMLAEAGVHESEYIHLKKDELIDFASTVEVKEVKTELPKAKEYEVPQELIDMPDLEKVQIEFQGKVIDSSAHDARILIKKGLAKLA